MPNNVVKLVLTAQDKTKAAFQSANKRVKSLKFAGAAIAKTFSVLSGAAALSSAAMGSFAKKATEAQKPLIDMAELIGASASELSELAIAGDLAGVGVTQLTTGLQRQTRRISEAAKGTGEAVKALKELGLEATSLNRLSPEKQFEQIANAMREVGNRGDQIRLAMRLWDSEGVKLLNTIDKIEEAQRIALETGATLTEKEVAAFNKMADAITKTDAAYRSLGQTVVSAGLGLKFEALKTTSLGIAETWVKLAATGSVWDITAAAILRLLGDAEQADEIMVKILDRFDSLDSSSVAEAADDVEDLGGSLDNLNVGKFQDFIQSMRDANQVLELRERGLSDQAEITSAVIALEKQLGRAVSEGEETAIAAEIQLRNELKDSIKFQADEQKRLNSVYEGAKNPADELTQTFVDLNTILERGDISFDTYTERVFELQEQIEGLAEKAEETGVRMSVFAEQAARNMQDDFAEFLFDPFEEDGLKGMLDGFVTTLRKMAAQAAAAKIFESLGTAASGSTNAFVAGIGSFLTPRAMGGPLAAGQLALVGERGPELFIPSTSGTVASNNDLSSMGAITVNVTAPPGRDSQSASQFGFEVASALSLAQRRNG